MKDPGKLFELWRLADSYSARPSEILGISCDIQSFYLDRACWLFGSRLDSEMSQVQRNAKNDTARKTAAQQVLKKALDRNKVGEPQKGQSFKDPALMKR